nr:hypothetical protein [uncultured Rhodopila sp.]
MSSIGPVSNIMIPAVTPSPLQTPAPVKPAADSDGDNDASAAAASGGTRLVDIKA